MMPDSSDDELRFDVVQPASAAATVERATQTCIGCRRPIVSEYYAIQDKLVCPSCRAQVDAAPTGSTFVRVFTALTFGLGAGLLGAAIWLTIRKIAHVEIGLIAVLVGFMVGKAVRKGSGGRGGRGYQIMAVLLTYACISANYMPDVMMALLDRGHEHTSQSHQAVASSTQPNNADTATAQKNPTALQARPKIGAGKAALGIAVLIGVVFAVSLAAPFLGGMQNIIGLLIIGFALWEAWKFNRRRVLPITGPYRLGGSTVSGVVV